MVWIAFGSLKGRKCPPRKGSTTCFTYLVERAVPIRALRWQLLHSLHHLLQSRRSFQPHALESILKIAKCAGSSSAHLQVPPCSHSSCRCARHSGFDPDPAKCYSDDIQKRFNGAGWTLVHCWAASSPFCSSSPVSLNSGACGKYNFVSDQPRAFRMFAELDNDADCSHEYRSALDDSSTIFGSRKIANI